MKINIKLSYKVILATLLILFLIQSGYSENDTLIKQTFGEHFELKRSETGELMTIAAISADSENIYLYDMADRTIASFDIDGKFVRKIKLQSIGRGEYIGDDFVVRNNEIIFLNTVDSRLEFFDIEKGLFRQSIIYPKEIPLEGNQRRYKLINRIFLDNSTIWIGNNHAVFSINENVILQKITAKQVKKFFDGSLLVIYSSKDPIMYRSGKIEWREKTALANPFRYTLPGKSFVVFNGKIYNCIISESGFSVISNELTENK